MCITTTLSLGIANQSTRAGLALGGMPLLNPAAISGTACRTWTSTITAAGIRTWTAPIARLLTTRRAIRARGRRCGSRCRCLTAGCDFGCIVRWVLALASLTTRRAFRRRCGGTTAAGLRSAGRAVGGRLASRSGLGGGSAA